MLHMYLFLRVPRELQMDLSDVERRRLELLGERAELTQADPQWLQEVKVHKNWFRHAN